MSALTERITEVLREHLPVRPGERVDCCGASISGRVWAAHVADEIQAELVKADYVADVQAAIVNAMNAVGVTLLGSTFELIESSPIPDDEIVALLAATWSEVQP